MQWGKWGIWQTHTHTNQIKMKQHLAIIWQQHNNNKKSMVNAARKMPNTTITEPNETEPNRTEPTNLTQQQRKISLTFPYQQ